MTTAHPAEIVAEQDRIARDKRIAQEQARLDSEANLRRIEEQRESNRLAADRAEAETRERTPFECCVEVGGVRVDFTLGQDEPVARDQTALGINRAIARLTVWHRAIINIARLRAVGKAKYDAAPAEEVAALIADDLRHVTARGHAVVSLTK